MAKITRKQIEKEVAEKLGVPKKEVNNVVSAFIESVVKHLEAKENVQLFPLGSFHVMERKRKYYDFAKKAMQEGNFVSVKFRSIHFKKFFKNKK
jgi:nucleoid DNA-binding protein